MLLATTEYGLLSSLMGFKQSFASTLLVYGHYFNSQNSSDADVLFIMHINPIRSMPKMCTEKKRDVLIASVE